MLDLFSLLKLGQQNTDCVLNNIQINDWAVVLENIGFFSTNKPNIFIFDTQEEAEALYIVLRNLNLSPYLYLGLEHSPYSHFISSYKQYLDQIYLLNSINKGQVSIIISTSEAIRAFVPPKSFFNNVLKLNIDDIITHRDLSEKLISIGYSHEETANEPLTFCIKGEIVDIFPINSDPIRLLFFDELIEQIYFYDPISFKTLKDNKLNSVEILASPFTLIDSEAILKLRDVLQKPKANEKSKFAFRNELLSSFSNPLSVPNISMYMPLIYRENCTLVDYLPSDINVHLQDIHNIKISNGFFKTDLMRQYHDSLNSDSNNAIFPSPEYFYDFNLSLIDKGTKFFINSLKKSDPFYLNFKNFDLNIKNLMTEISLSNINENAVYSKKEKFLNYLKRNINHFESIFIYSNNDDFIKELNFLFETHNIFPSFSKIIHFRKANISSGFYFSDANLLFVSENDIYVSKSRKTKKNQSYISDNLFAEQIASLKIGDYVIHSDYGVGKYAGLQELDIGGIIDDFVLIVYEGGDKVYVPTYKLNLIQKHSDSTASLKLSNLNTNKFEQQKSKARESVKKLAFDLLELQAKRKLKKGFSYSPPDHLYNDFELSFPFEETPDQKKAIQDILEDMQSETPMDRLICGDVGFGKTEVALRAAYKAVLDNKQVCVLVPTTILAYQHYNSFVKRFKNTPTVINFISRFKTAKEKKEILNDVSLGKIDILIGTHSLLSDNIKYKDLGLVIVDEEHRFGVAHKEKLKLIKENVDYITMTATPIPRTLQMSFLGIRDLSLIQTPPPRRQSIKSFIINEDDETIKMAIERELNRGGQVFIIHNRVQDIEIYASKIMALVPKAKLVFAHGQMPEKELEKKITQFYNGEFDILLATTIIESGIDIPNANTMIIDRADTFGLAQLHQLRGRIGRSDKKAYAYFIIRDSHLITETGQKRLKALQTYSEVGAGFSLATQDLEIRGAGDILGPEQSGHISNIGLELYMDLLQDAVNELKSTDKTFPKRINTEISVHFKTSIPESYIADSGVRLKIYKRLSSYTEIEKINSVKEELIDIYGKIPSSLENLFCVLESRLFLSKIGITQLKSLKESVLLKFDKLLLQNNELLQNKIFKFFTSRPRLYKINPDFSVLCQSKVISSGLELLDFSKGIARDIEAC